MKVIAINLPNILIIGLVVMLWRFAFTMMAARWPNSLLTTSAGLIGG